LSAECEWVVGKTTPNMSVRNHEPRLISPVIFRNQPDEDVQRTMIVMEAVLWLVSFQPGQKWLSRMPSGLGRMKL